MSSGQVEILMLLLLVWVVRASDGTAEEPTHSSEDFHITLDAQESQLVLDPPEAHQVASPGQVSATQPYIDPATPLHVKAYVGVTASLPCIVNNLGQRSVSWVRHRDIHVLTVGRFTFTNDDRFVALHEDGSNAWILNLRSPTTNDTGTYECQINTKPTLSQLITLDVVEPQAIITAGRELYVDAGSSLSLTCQIVNAPAAPEFLLWYHEQQVANYVEHVHVDTSHVNGTTTSTLVLDEARVHNSGKYTCSASNAREASITVHVLSGEEPRAMQTNGAGGMLLPLPHSPLLFLLTGICCLLLLPVSAAAAAAFP
ncbi:zwei Ig domain protein zig-8-like [Penaeus japonicus]|uniref:zwei Ig domain protein zig-8-like n=1 Tax=Penaeus japonicus TaxID=27405 RepID=UPI001C712BDB|nr:zwei Ig domain protein zig-8-like [Penaeus japonicus]